MKYALMFLEFWFACGLLAGIWNLWQWHKAIRLHWRDFLNLGIITLLGCYGAFAILRQEWKVDRSIRVVKQ